ncbi:unnamed protein product [Blepharisma stoltei]|uniref:Uncharacterized protein n=1 Tax=Blepharisma stoltei TaxID=1481888 RepID=A0AAU9JLH0_9CILI|nr:unnamed protein product [Blepharisma stoltei]
MPYTEEGAMVGNITVDVLILAAKKTAESKPVTIVYTSGIGLNGNTAEIIDENHDDISHCPESAAPRGILEKKVINASTENLHGVALRVGWVYGKSFVDQWLKFCKVNNYIYIGGDREDSHICFIHHEDLANMYRVLIEKKAYGLFFAVEPEPVTLQNLIERVSTLGNIHETEKVNPWEHFLGPYGLFLLGHELDQQLYPKRFIDLYDFQYNHKFLDWINFFPFNQIFYDENTKFWQIRNN